MPNNTLYDEMFSSNQIMRKETIQQLLASPIRFVPFRFRGTNVNLPVVSVKLSLPIYRIENRRTKTLQEEYLTKHTDLSKDFFSLDQDSIAVQEAQDEILRELINEKYLYDVFTNPKVQQDEPIVCTQDGMVVNGNRRMCAWRKLLLEDPVKYAHFQAVEIALLPPDADEDDINDIERDLQIKRAIKSEYSWHARANMIRTDAEKVRSYEELAQLYDMTKADVINAIACFEYAKSYLDSIGKTGQWSLVDKQEFAFKKILKERSRIKTIPEQKIFEACATAVLRANADQIGDRRYDVIPSVAKNLGAIIEVVKRDIVEPVPDVTIAQDPLGITQASDNYVELFRVEEACRNPENLDKTIGVINAVLESASIHGRDVQSGRILLDDLTRISTDLISAKNNDLDDRQEHLAEVKNQLKAIMETCEDIRKWVEHHESKD